MEMARLSVNPAVTGSASLESERMKLAWKIEHGSYQKLRVQTYRDGLKALEASPGAWIHARCSIEVERRVAEFLYTRTFGS